MDNTTLAIIAAIGLGAIVLMRTGNREQMFYVPGVGNVPESQLPNYGYQKFNGLWYSSSQIQAVMAQAGVQPGTTVTPGTTTWNTIATILSTLIGLTTTIITEVNNANRIQAINDILAKYTEPSSSSYNANFPYTRTQLEAFTNQQLQNILNTGTL